MESRPADERPTRLSLVPLMRDLDAVAAERPDTPAGPKSHMEWDDSPPSKVRQRFRKVIHREARAGRAVALERRIAAGQAVGDTTALRCEEAPKVAQGSVANARAGIGRRIQQEATNLRNYDELMSPSAFAQQRALPPLTRFDTKLNEQEASWPKKLKEKASIRSLKKKSSLPSLKKMGSSSSNVALSSPRPSSSSSPRPSILDNFAAVGLPPPVPAIPMRFIVGSQEPVFSASPMLGDMVEGKAQWEEENRKAPRIARDDSSPRTTPGQESPRPEATTDPEIAPFLAYEKWAPKNELRSPMSPSPQQARNFDSFGSTTSLNTSASTPPSREFPSGPEDPYWDEAVARVKAKVRLEQEKERREHKAAVKAEQKYIRSVSREHDEGRFKWAKQTVDMIIGKYDEHGWLPKKTPKDFSDEDWEFVLEVLSHKDTRALRDRLFKQPEWKRANKARRVRHEEEMRRNPTPEFLDAQKAKKEKERKEYGFRKALGMLTEEEKERELQKTPSSVGLGISMPSESGKSATQDQKSATSRKGALRRTEYSTTSGEKGSANDSFNTSTRHSFAQITDVFNTEGFNPRISRLGSDEVKSYIQRKSTEKSTESPVPPTPTLRGPVAHKTLDPRQEAGPASSSTSTPAVKQKQTPAPRAKLVKKAASANEMHKAYTQANRLPLTAKEHAAISRPFRLPPLGVHPAFRDPESPSATELPSQLNIPKSRTPGPCHVTSPIALIDSQAQSRTPGPHHVASPIAQLDSQAKSRLPGPRHVTSPVAQIDSQAKSRMQVPRNISTPIARPDSPTTSGGIRRHLVPAALSSLSREVPKLKRPPKPLKPSTSVKLPSEPVTIVHTTSSPSPTLSDIRAAKGRRRYAPHIRKPSTSVVFDAARSASDPVASSRPIEAVSSPPDTAGHMKVENALELAHPGKRIITPPDLHSAAGADTTAKPTLRQRKMRSEASLPKGVARLSSVPDLPDATDFSAVGVEPDYELDAAPLSQSTFTPRDRLIAKRSGTFEVAEADNAQAVANSTEQPKTQSGVVVRPVRSDSLQWNQSSAFGGKGRAPEGQMQDVPRKVQNAEEGLKPMQASSNASQESVDTDEVFELPSREWLAAQGQGRSEYFRGQAQAARARAPPTGQIDASFTRPADTQNLPSRAEVQETLEKHMPSPMPPRAGSGFLRQGMTPLGQPHSMTATPFKSFTSNLPPPTGPRPLVISNSRSVSQGNPSKTPASPSRSLAYNPRTNSNSSSTGMASASSRQGGYDPFTPSRRPPQSSGLDTSDDLDVSFAEVINAWQQHPSPNPTPGSQNSHASQHNQEIEQLRSEAGLEPMRERVSIEPKHPNHPYAFNTTKMMCRRVHNPGVVLPTLPSPTPAGRPAHMAEYAAEYFVGSPYTDEPSSPERCSFCGAFCCMFADAVAKLEIRTTDIVVIQENRRLGDVVAKLRAIKPNGVEEWDSFLKCSQCERRFCPNCVLLCCEELCQEPICIQCKEGTNLCRIHNFF